MIENSHPALITEEDFNAVQELMEKKGKYKSNGKESLFSYIAKCPDCGSGMHFKPDRRKGAYVCGGYVKYTSSYCSSHIIEEKVLLQAVKDNLKSLIKDIVKIENLYGIAEEKALTVHSNLQKELKRIENQLLELDKRFDKLIALHVEGAITTDQFKYQNERNNIQQQELLTKKAELIVALEEGKNLTERKEAFRKEVERFIQTIEVFEDGIIKINYNLSSPLPPN